MDAGGDKLLVARPPCEFCKLLILSPFGYQEYDVHLEHIRVCSGDEVTDRLSNAIEYNGIQVPIQNAGFFNDQDVGRVKYIFYSFHPVVAHRFRNASDGNALVS